MTDRINVRVDPDAYAEAKTILDELGISTSMAVNSFFRAMVRERGFPFPLTTLQLSEREAMLVPGPGAHAELLQRRDARGIDPETLRKAKEEILRADASDKAAGGQSSKEEESHD